MALDHLARTALFEGSERARQNSRPEELLELAIDIGAIGTFDYDSASDNIYWRNGAWRSFGREEGVIARETFFAQIDPQFRDWLISEVANAAERGDQTISLDFALHTAIAGVRRIDATGRIERDAAGALTRLTGIVRDSTECLARHDTLLARTAQLSSILKGLPEPLIVVDIAGTIVRIGHAAEKLFGSAAAVSIGQPIASLLPEIWPAMRDHTASLTDAPLPRIVRWVEGVRQTLEVKVNRVLAGPSDLLLLFITDASDRIDGERRRALLVERLTLEARSSAVGKFASHVAHEVTQPLAAASNFLGIAQHLARNDARGAAIAEPIEYAAAQIDRTGKIVRGLLDLALQRGNEKRAIDLRPAIEEAVALVLAAHGDLGIRVELELDPAVPAIFADRIQIQQVLANLLRNAVQALATIDHHPRDIVVRSRPHAANVAAIEIRDNGPGIDEAMLARLFTPFATSRGENGLGLGLSISRMIAEHHGGTLIGYNLARGACFRFTVPMADDDEGPARA